MRLLGAVFIASALVLARFAFMRAPVEPVQTTASTRRFDWRATGALCFFLAVVATLLTVWKRVDRRMIAFTACTAIAVLVYLSLTRSSPKGEGNRTDFQRVLIRSWFALAFLLFCAAGPLLPWSVLRLLHSLSPLSWSVLEWAGFLWWVNTVYCVIRLIFTGDRLVTALALVMCLLSLYVSAALLFR